MKSLTLVQLMHWTIRELNGAGQLKAVKVAKGRVRGFVLVAEDEMQEFRAWLGNTGWHVVGE
jgi:hypothetical protein